MTALSVILVAVFSAGGAAVIGTIVKGVSGWRAGAARTEARAIQNLEKYRDEADRRALIQSHRADANADLAEYWRNRAGNAEYKIRTTWGEIELPPVAPIPVYVPLDPPTKAITEVTENG